MMKIKKEATEKLSTEKYGAMPIIISPEVISLQPNAEN